FSCATWRNSPTGKSPRPSRFRWGPSCHGCTAAVRFFDPSSARLRCRAAAAPIPEPTMDCRDVRDLADSFLADELLTETNHEMLRHLAGCQSCRSELAERRSLRDGVRRAVAGAAFRDGRPEGAATLHRKVRQTAREAPARR